jgi:hypothetical protein
MEGGWAGWVVPIRRAGDFSRRPRKKACASLSSRGEGMAFLSPLPGSGPSPLPLPLALLSLPPPSLLVQAGGGANRGNRNGCRKILLHIFEKFGS